MKRINRDLVPKGSKIITGSRGGQYYINKHGEKVLIRNSYEPRRSFKPRRGQFLRWLEAQSEVN